MFYIVSETAMTEEGGCIHSNATGSRATDNDTLPGNRLPAEGRDLTGEVHTPCEVSVTPDYDDLFDVSVSLQSLIGLPPDFCEALESLGGCSLSLATKLMSSHDTSGSGEFVAGQLCGTEEQRKFYSQTLDAGPMVSRWMRSGYELPFATIPPIARSASNNKSLFTNITFARAEIVRQVKMGILSEVPWKPFIINPISVVFTNKWRMVVDCRLLNPFLVKRKIKLEDLRVVPDLVSEGNFMSTDDLEKGYWQVPLNPKYRKYIGISLDNKYSVANVLILGVSDAVYAFMKINRPIIRYVRSLGVKAAVYIDNFFTSHQPFEHLFL